jgi:hypothetical protein
MALFTNPDGSPCAQPCLFGVRPGKTTLDDALKILDRHPLTHSLKQQPYVTLNAKGQSVQRGAELLSRGADLIVMSDDGIAVNWVQIMPLSGSSAPLAHPLPTADSRLTAAIGATSPGNMVLTFGDPSRFGRLSDVSEVQWVYYRDARLLASNRLMKAGRIDPNGELLSLTIFATDLSSQKIDLQLMKVGQVRWAGFTYLHGDENPEVIR